MATIYDVIKCWSWIVKMFKIILLVLIFTCIVKKKVEKKKKKSFSLLKSAYFEF
jgi:flagellar biogenesis protein FliO